MTDKPEHVSDLESGAIVRVEVRPGDAADNDASLCERVLAAARPPTGLPIPLRLLGRHALRSAPGAAAGEVRARTLRGGRLL